ncbi:hypothetical protein ACFLT9_11195 [Acidobacteriota bacterium]
MKRINGIYFFTLIISLCLTVSTIQAQFTAEEIQKRSQIEKLLRSADISKFEEIGEGVTKPFCFWLQEGEFELKGCWKNPKGMKDGFLEGWQYEIAAYEIDKLLELNMIPPTVERKFKNKKGSLQFWVDAEMSDLDRMDDGIEIPTEYQDSWAKGKYMMRAFDSLIANEDRTQQNILYAKPWRIIMIDHSRSFRSSKKFTERLVGGRNGIKGVQLMRMLPRKFVENIKALNFENIQNAVGPYLKKKEINAILKRRDLLLEEIQYMIKERGEENFLY